MENNTRTTSANGSCETNGAAEAEILPPYVPEMQPARVRLSRETMQNPCFWILIGAGLAVGVGALVVYVSRKDR